MKRYLPRLTYANVVASLALFLVLAGGTAFAASHLGKNSVGSKQLKKNAVTSAKIKNNAVTSAKIKNGAISGSKVNLASLGTVPSATSATSATTATTAANVTGRIPYNLRLNIGASQTLASNGTVSLVATCTQEGEKLWARILEQTTANGAVAYGEDSFDGNSSTEFLNVTTPASERELTSEYESAGKTYVTADNDGGFVLGSDGKLLSIDTEAFAIGLNYVSPGCLFEGVIDSVG